MERFDVVVLGGGPGGYVAAIRCSQLGLKTAVVEREHLGGVCLNWGCIPTKSLVSSAQALQTVRRAASFGIQTGEIRADYAAAHRRSRQVSARLAGGVDYLMKKNGITVFADEGELLAPDRIRLRRADAVLHTAHCIVATGSSPAEIPHVDFGRANILHSKKALALDQAPQKAVIVGAGAIGMEFASIWRAYGADVTVVEWQDRILPNEDAGLSRDAEKAYSKAGIRFLTSHRLEKAEENENGTLSVSVAGDGQASRLDCDKLLICTGVRPNTSGIGLEAAGVELDRGFVRVNDRMETSVKGVYAIGDITGKMALAHVASAQGMIAAQSIASLSSKPIQYAHVPSCIYGMPEIASIGLTQKAAEEAGLDVAASSFPLQANGRALASGEPEGYVKLITDKASHKILGAHMIGGHVAELIAQVALMMEWGATAEQVSRVIYPHPSLSESLVEAAHMAAGYPLNI